MQDDSQFKTFSVKKNLKEKKIHLAEFSPKRKLNKPISCTHILTRSHPRKTIMFHPNYYSPDQRFHQKQPPFHVLHNLRNSSSQKQTKSSKKKVELSFCKSSFFLRHCCHNVQLHALRNAIHLSPLLEHNIPSQPTCFH